MNFADIHLGWKIGTGGLVVVMTVMGWLSTTFYSKAEAQQYQQQHGQQLIQVRVQQIEVLISQYRYQLLSTQLSPAQREWIQQEIDRLTELINCIRAGRC